MGSVEAFAKASVYVAALCMVIEGIVCFFSGFNPLVIFEGVYFMYAILNHYRLFGLLLASAQCGFTWYKSYFSFLESFYGRSAFCSLYFPSDEIQRGDINVQDGLLQ